MPNADDLGPRISDMISRIAARGGTSAPAGVPGADTRVAPVPSGALYENLDHPTLKAMVTSDVDPEQVGTLAEAWREAGTRLAQFQDDVAGAVNASRGEWQGAAGELARGFIAGLGVWIGQAGRGAQLAGTQAAKHSEALATARNAMPEPVPFDVDAANAELRSITDPVLLLSRYAAHMEAYAAQQAAQRRAAEVVSNYDNALAEAALMPAFAPPPTMTGDAPTRSALPPLPRVSHDSPVSQGGSTSPQSAAPSSSSTSIPDRSPDHKPVDTPPQSTAAMPMAGGFAVGAGMDSGARNVDLSTPPGGATAAHYATDPGDDSIPPVIGG
ncbi:hypothetical protein [Actinocrispum sp. NPDC049592]|uniref:hypothetical protein n=1 Tax=Actinocrispum sp. NPDC049592 TaxID=3154835 RepID=UPI00344750DB